MLRETAWVSYDPAVRNVIERVEQLIALASSSNENEARTAALLAVQLIRKHGLVLVHPSGEDARSRVKPDPGTRTTSRNEAARSERGARPKSTRGARRVADPPEKIVAPLGGECVHCGGRYRADATVYWFASGGGMHPRCFDEWSRAR